MNDVLEAARRIVAWDDSGRLADDEWLVEKNETAIIAICRALLGMREALEMAEGTLLIASRMLTEDHKMVLNGKRWGDKTIKAVNAALSSVRGEGGDKQATRASGPTAPTDRLQSKE